MTKDPRRWWAIGAASLATVALSGLAPQAVAQEEEAESVREQIEQAVEQAAEAADERTEELQDEADRDARDADATTPRLRDPRERAEDRGDEAAEDARERGEDARKNARERADEFRDEGRDRARDRGEDPRDQRRDAREPRAGARAERDQQGPTIGVLLSPSPTTGVLVDAVRPGGSADRAGIRRGDYILSIGGSETNSPEALTDALRDVGIGNQANVVVWRNEQRQRLTMRLEEQSRPAGNRQESRFGARPEEGLGARAEEEGLGARAEDEAFANAPWLGLALESGEQGVRISRVYPASPAARAGLRSGDEILSIDGEQADSRNRIGEIVPQLEIGEEAEIVVMRDGNERTLTVLPGRRGDYLPSGEQSRTFGEGEEFSGDFDPSAEIPEHAMMLEQHRHLATQHQRMEQLLVEMKQELTQLRKQVDELQNGAPRRGAGDEPARPATPDEDAPVEPAPDEATPEERDEETVPDAAEPDAADEE